MFFKAEFNCTLSAGIHQTAVYFISAPDWDTALKIAKDMVANATLRMSLVTLIAV